LGYWELMSDAVDAAPACGLRAGEGAGNRDRDFNGLSREYIVHPFIVERALDLRNENIVGRSRWGAPCAPRCH